MKPNIDMLLDKTLDADIGPAWKAYTIGSTNRVIDISVDGYNGCIYLIQSYTDVIIRSATGVAAGAALDLDGYGSAFPGGYKRSVIQVPSNHAVIVAKSADNSASKLRIRKIGQY